MSEISVDNVDVQPNAFETVAQVGAFQGVVGEQPINSGPATSVTSISGLRGDISIAAAAALAGFQITVSPSGTTITIGISVSATITPQNVNVAKLLIQGVGAVLTVAANAITPTNCIHNINNAGGLIKTINVPAGFTGVLWLIAGTVPYTTDATGNISRAITPAAGQATAYVYDGTLWNPDL
jgi:hypothetical protein